MSKKTKGIIFKVAVGALAAVMVAGVVLPILLSVLSII